MPISPPYRRRRRRPQDDFPPPGQYPGTMAPQPPAQNPRAYHPAMPFTEALIPNLMTTGQPALGPQLGPYGLRSVGDRHFFPVAETLSNYQPGDPVGGPAVPLGGGIPPSGASVTPAPSFRKVIDESGYEIVTPPAGGFRHYLRGHFQRPPPVPDAPMPERGMPPLGGEGRMVRDVERCHLCRRTPIVGARHPAGPSVATCPRCGKMVCPDCEVKHALAGYTRNSFPCPSQH